METVDFMWLASFTALLFTSYLFNNLVVKSLMAKPLGKQTIFDSAIRDTFFAMKFYVTVACLMCISGRFYWIRFFFIENNVLLSAVCSVYSFGFTCVNVSAGCLCSIRTLSILNVNFLEETVGESKVRLISNLFVITTGVFAVVVFNAAGEINSGTPIALVTYQTAPLGRYSNLLFFNIITLGIIAILKIAGGYTSTFASIKYLPFCIMK